MPVDSKYCASYGFASSMTEQSIFKDVPFSVPGRAARMSALSVRPVLSSIAHFDHFESTEVSVFPAEVVDAKTSVEESPVAVYV